MFPALTRNGTPGAAVNCPAAVARETPIATAAETTSALAAGHVGSDARRIAFVAPVVAKGAASKIVARVTVLRIHPFSNIVTHYWFTIVARSCP